MPIDKEKVAYDLSMMLTNYLIPEALAKFKEDLGEVIYLSDDQLLGRATRIAYIRALQILKKHVNLEINE